MNVGDIFTEAEIQQAMRFPQDIKKIEHDIVIPVMRRIDEATGQANDSMYMAYLLQYAVTVGVKTL